MAVDAALKEMAEKVVIPEEKIHQRRHVEQQRPITPDQELVEGEAGRRRDLRHEGREPEYAVGDLGHAAVLIGPETERHALPGWQGGHGLLQARRLLIACSALLWV